MNRATRALLIASVFFGVAILAFVLTTGGTTRVVRMQTTVVEAPPLTPLLRDSGPKNNAVRSRASRGERAPVPSVLDEPARRSRGQSGTQNGPLPSRARARPKTTHKRPVAPHKPNTSGQATQPTPAQPRPPVSATVPAPVTVCTKLAAVNC